MIFFTPIVVKYENYFRYIEVPLYFASMITQYHKQMVNGIFDFFRECHIDNHVTERTDLPDHLIVGSQGTEIFTQEFPRVTVRFCARVCSDSLRRMAVFYTVK